MPSTGTPRSNSPVAGIGAPSASTDIGPPERMMPFGAKALISASGRSGRWISQYTPSSRTRRAISWVYWLPKSRMRTFSS